MFITDTDACGQTLTNEVQFKSPSYPDKYSSHEHCIISICAPNATDVIELHILDFELEAPSALTGYCYDKFKLYDGPDTSATLMGNFCGTIITPQMFQSTGSSLTVKFVSDHNVQRKGFLAEIVFKRC